MPKNKVKINKIFEDDHLLVIDKPAGVVVNRSATSKFETLQDWLVENGYGKEVFRNGIVHRLDKDTSGLLVVAKTNEMMEKIQSLFKNRLVQKEYQCLVHGLVKPDKGVVEAPITRNPFNRQRFGVFVGGKGARTEYQVIGKYKKGSVDYSLLKVKPITGRTHQIRVHLKHLNYPIVADPWYGGRKRYLKDKNWCDKLFLRAVKIGFKHPETSKQVLLEVDLSLELKQVLKSLKKA